MTSLGLRELAATNTIEGDTDHPAAGAGRKLTNGQEVCLRECRCSRAFSRKGTRAEA